VQQSTAFNNIGEQIIFSCSLRRY